MIEENIERYYTVGARAINTGDWEAYASLYAEDLLMVTPGIPGPTTGRDVRVKLAQGLVNAFPDARVELLRSFGKGDWACFEVLFTGTHTGPMPGRPGPEMRAVGRLSGVRIRPQWPQSSRPAARQQFTSPARRSLAR